MTVQDYFDAGMAIMIYDIRKDTSTFRYEDKEFSIPTGSVPTILSGDGFQLAAITDVLITHERLKNEQKAGA